MDGRVGRTGSLCVGFGNGLREGRLRHAGSLRAGLRPRRRIVADLMGNMLDGRAAEIGDCGHHFLVDGTDAEFGRRDRAFDFLAASRSSCARCSAAQRSFRTAPFLFSKQAKLRFSRQ
jgi:hypothetical protein